MKSKGHLIQLIKKDQKKIHVQVLLLAFGVLAFSIFSVSDLEWESRISLTKGALLFLNGLIFFPCLYNALNAFFVRTTYGQKLMRRHHLSIGDVFEISNKSVSSVQAIFCCATGAVCSCYSCQRDLLRTSHYISEAYAWFGAAYFFYDIWSMYRVHCAKSHDYRLTYYIEKNAVMIFHHFFIGIFGFLVITYLRGGLGDCFFGFIYLMEASTPFVSFRTILASFGLKKTKLYLINGLFMMIIFFFCRILMFPLVLLFYSHSTGLEYFKAIATLPNGCKISILLLLLPQIYWFRLMIEGANNAFKTMIQNGNVAHQIGNCSTLISNNGKKKNKYYRH